MLKNLHNYRLISTFTPMKIYTGYFAAAKKYRAAGLVCISTARFVPKWETGIAELKLLAPRADMLQLGKFEYEPKFKAILRTLSAAWIMKVIGELSNGQDCVLLCYESAAKCKTGEEFCHRFMIAEWLEKMTGVKIEEYNVEKPEPPKPTVIQGELF